ncbi:MAG: hypothetical protein JWL60_791 [Gemmatimonadetes bacterium]|jgi:predicted alpha/beta-fold hydrolase|nr:hypothetical protein [Gemmatimonadota bacterium]
MPHSPPRPFIPAWWLPGAHLQTLWGKLARRLPEVRTRAERWATPDGDELEIHRVDGAIEAPRLLLLHGLEGTIRSHYLRGTLARARERGWSADVLLFRSCNGEVPRARRMYHSGETTDLDLVVRRLVREHPGQPLVLAGFSLGGNVLLKWLGEQGDDVPAEVHGAAAVSVPFDLAAGSRHIERGFARVYTRSFMQSLRRKAMARLSRDPDLFDPAALARARTLHDFDDAVTAPVHGFASATDYYTRSSSIHFLARIRRPTLLLSATDDPFLPRSVLRDVVELARSNPAIHMETHDHGGHVGFVGGRLPWHPDHYAERRLLEFLASHLSDSAVASARRRG